MNPPSSRPPRAPIYEAASEWDPEGGAVLNEGIPTKVIAASVGLCGFAAAVVAGLGAGNPAPTVLVRALIALFACYVVGLCVGMVGERTVREHAVRAAEVPSEAPASTATPAPPAHPAQPEPSDPRFKRGNQP